MNCSNESRTDGCDCTDSVSSYLWMIVPPLLLLFGLTGNILALVVLRKLGWCRHPTMTFLTFLAVNDSIVLLTGLTQYWTQYVFNVDIRGFSDVNCKLYFFVIYLSMQYSSWILVGVSTERLIKVYFPFKYKRMYNIKKVSIGLTVTLFVLALVNVHFFVTNGINAEGCCDSLEGFEDFNEKVFTFIDFALLSAGPFLIMLIGNIFLVRILTTEQKRRATMMHHSMVVNANRFSIKMTKMLVVCTIYFVLATAPVSIYFILDTYLKKEGEPCNPKMQQVKAVTYLFQYSSHCVNFYLYTAMNDRFRKELRNMMCCKTSFQLSVLFSTRQGSSDRSFANQSVASTSAGIEANSLSENNRSLASTIAGTERNSLSENYQSVTSISAGTK